MQTCLNTFIFDCFGVICSPTIMDWYQHNSRRYGFVDEHLPSLFEQFDLGLLSEDDIFQHFSRYQGITATKEQIGTEVDGCLKLDHALTRFIGQLKERGIKTALLSNANAAFFERKLYPTYPEFKDLFNEIVISSSVGMVKPQQEIYQYTLNRLGSKAQETLFIDDNPRNVEAALQLPMHGYVYTSFPTFVEYVKNKQFVAWL